MSLRRSFLAKPRIQTLARADAILEVVLASKTGATAAMTALSKGCLSMKGLDNLVELVRRRAECHLPRLE